MRRFNQTRAARGTVDTVDKSRPNLEGADNRAGPELDGSPIARMTRGSELPFESYVDSITPQRITGWCWFPDRPDLVPTVRVRAGAAVVVTARADQFRQDLADAGKRCGACAFDIALPPLSETRARSLRVELLDGRPLRNGECFL